MTEALEKNNETRTNCLYWLTYFIGLYRPNGFVHLNPYHCIHRTEYPMRSRHLGIFTQVLF